MFSSSCDYQLESYSNKKRLAGRALPTIDPRHFAETVKHLIDGQDDGLHEPISLQHNQDPF